jgi:uroporphyrinogen decarboxylase
MYTSKERVLKAVNHETADRVPITFDAEKEVYDMLYQNLGIHTKEALFNRLNVDTWMILPWNFIYPEAEHQKTEKTSIWGYQTRVTPYSGGAYDELFYCPLAGKDQIEDIRNHPWPADDLVGFEHYPSEIAAHRNRAILGVFTWGAYFIATHVRGLENLMMDFAMRQEYADLLINTIAEKSLVYLTNMLENYGEGIDIVYMADDYCSQQGPLFSPAAFRQFVMPYLTRMVELVHRYAKKFLLHVCGAVRPLLPMIIEAGVDMLEPIQIRAVGMEPEGLKRDFGRDICFYGGMDLQQILCHGSPQDVAAEARHLIDVLGKNGGYVFGPGHTYIQIDAPFDNIMAMYQTAASYRPW